MKVLLVVPPLAWADTTAKPTKFVVVVVAATARRKAHHNGRVEKGVMIVQK